MKRVFMFIFMSVFCLCLSSCDFFKNPTELNKMQIKIRFDYYNDEYSLNLPSDFEKVYSYLETTIDSEEELMVVKVSENYKLDYSVQCICDLHDEFDIVTHFKLINDSHDELKVLEKTLSEDYDWYAYEQRHGSRIHNLFVIRDNCTNYLYVYYYKTQYIDCF